MPLIFTKGAARTDRLDVIRTGAPAETIDCPKQGIVPHDMVHYAVETVLHARGFVTRVAEGEAAAFAMQADAESDGVERLVEVMQADGWSGWTGAPQDLLDLYALTCRARGCAPLAVTAADLEAVRARLLALTAQWSATATGASLVLPLHGEGDDAAPAA